MLREISNLEYFVTFKTKREYAKQYRYKLKKKSNNKLDGSS